MLSQQLHSCHQINDPRQICWGLVFGPQDAAVPQRLSEQSSCSSISIPEVGKSDLVFRNTSREADKGRKPGDSGFAASVTAPLGRKAAVMSC